MSDNYKNFTIKYDEFRAKNGGEKYRHIKDWYYTLQKRHRIIRDKLGGISNCQLVEIEDNKNIEPSVPLYNIQWIINDLLHYIPNYFKDTKLNQVDLTKPILSDGTKVTKSILSYARDKKLALYNMQYLERTVSNLANLYTSDRVSPGKYYIYITTDPMGFIRLGNYGVDAGSCFGQAGCNWTHKLHLGKSSNTYVALISSSNFDENGNSEGLIGRAWGFLSGRSGKVVNVCNIYNNKSMNNQKPMGGLIKRAFEQIYNCELNRFENLVRVGTPLYLNEGPFSLTASKELKDLQMLRHGRFLYPSKKKGEKILEKV